MPMAPRKKLGRIKELSEINSPVPPGQIAERAVEVEESLPRGSPLGVEPAASPDDTPPPIVVESRTEPTGHGPGIVNLEVVDRAVTLLLPAPVLLRLEERARRENAPLGVVVSQALAAAGYHVGPQQRMRLPRRRQSAYPDLARAFALLALLSR